MKPDHLKRSRLAFGVALICAVFLLETVLAHRRFPSPASPLVWGLLAGVAAAALVFGWWSGRQARRAATGVQASVRGTGAGL